MQPRLRFKEFTDNWEEKKLGDIGENIIGLTYSPEDITKDDLFPIVLRSSNIQNDRLDLTDIVRVKTSIPKKIFVQNGDILICTRNGSKRLIGKNIRLRSIDNPIVFGAFMSIFRSQNNGFVEHLFRTEKYHEQIQVNLGATINQITTGNLNKFLFSFPTPEEQQKIASFLSAVDEKISQLTEKNNLLTKYKKGVMQKIFSKELRFKADDGIDYPSWEEKKLEQIAFINMGQSPNSSSYNSEGNGTPLIQGNADIKNRVTTPRTWTSEPTKHCSENDIILTVRAPVGAVAKSNIQACIGRGVCAITPMANTSKEYLYQLLVWYESFKWLSIEQGSTFTAVSGADIKGIECPTPSTSEQTKIANFLSAIDEKIENNQLQLQAIKQYKQGLLQQMFV